MTKQSILATIGTLTEPQLINFMEPIFDLVINLPSQKSRKVLQALHQQLRTAIVDGRLQSGLQLPPTRKLASVLGISRNTVIAAYDLLLSEGYIISQAGAGTFVANMLRQPLRQNSWRSNNSPDKRINVAWRTPSILLKKINDEKYAFNFQVGVPDLSVFPFQTWRRLSARTLRLNIKSQGVYADSAGYPKLRAAIAKYVSYARAVACEPEDIFVTTGAQQAFDILARILVTPGQTVVAVEEPGYPPMRSAFIAAGATIVTIPVDAEGLVVDLLPTNANIICVTPSHQFPLGVQLTLARRAALLNFVYKHGAIIIEDDYDGEFRYGGKPVDALQTLDRKGTVFYIGTFSKNMFPALRLGFAVVPPWAKQAFLAAKQLSDWHSSLHAQATLAMFIDDGYLAQYIRKVRKIYSKRREIILQTLERYCNEWLQPIGVETGLHLTAYLKSSFSAALLVKEAQKLGINLCSLERYGLKQITQNGLVFGYGKIHQDHIDTAIHRLANILNRYVSNNDNKNIFF